MALGIKSFVGVLGLLCTAEILSGAFHKASITTIERRFDLTSTATAMISTSYQIGNLSVLLFVSYYGSKLHRPRLLAIGALLIVIGNVIASLPQFLGGRYEYVDITQHNQSQSKIAISVELCENQEPSGSPSPSVCSEVQTEKQSSESNLYIFIVVGIILCGIGGAGTSPLGFAYVDDYSHPENRPVYIGTILTLALIGPAFGFIMGAMILRVWVDVGWVDTSKITINPYNPGWVGAWWLGFLISAGCLLITGSLFWIFPRSMPVEKLRGKKGDSNKQESEMIRRKEQEKRQKEKDALDKQELSGFFTATKRVLTTPTFLYLLLLWFFGGQIMVGTITFTPKYIETQFGQSASAANMVYGAVNVPALVLGTMLGSALLKKFALNSHGISKLIAIVSCITFVVMVPLAFIGCETIDIAGISLPYSENTELVNPDPSSACNSNCDCQEGVYSPVCGEDGITYMSPCYAGCVNFELNENSRIENYTDCSCIPSPEKGGNLGGWAVPGRCEKSKCAGSFKYMMLFKSLASFVGGFLTTPVYLLILSSVEARDKSLAIGLSNLIIRVLVWIPSPIYYGKIIDTSCLYWGYKPCSSSAYCKIYDNTAFRHRLFFIILGWKVCSLFASFALCRHLKKENKEKTTKTSSFADDEKKSLNGNGVPVVPSQTQTKSVAEYSEESEYDNNEKPDAIEMDEKYTLVSSV